MKHNFPFSYIGGVNQTAKMQHGIKYNIDTFAVYLAPSNLSGKNVCAKATTECIMGCLNTSGRVKMDKKNIIVNARINRTLAFYEQREAFMKLLVNEITLAKKRAEKKGNIFAVRLNGTSDLSPVLFKHEGKTLFELFPDVTFYDYTKVDNRVKVMVQYPNYDLTFSYSGYNWSECETMLANNVRVAVIFDVKAGKPLPKTFNGYEVVDGDETDYRPANPKKCIVGLRWKVIANKANNDAIRNSPFVIKTNGLQDVIVKEISKAA
jgi:uncharacterized membrane protein